MIISATTPDAPKYLQDAAFQALILQRCGMRVSRVYIVHINNSYVRDGGIDIRQLFSSSDVTEKAQALSDMVNELSGSLRDTLQSGKEPQQDIGIWCNDGCDFDQYCWQHVPEPSVFDIAWMHAAKRFELYYQGIIKIEDVPDGMLNPKQRQQRDSWIAKSVTYDRGKIKAFLELLEYPLAFMDFETANSAMPLFDNSRPYQQVPFQFSLHVLRNPDAVLEHYEYLGDGGCDPRQGFARALLDSLPESGSVLVWNQAFEIRCLRELAGTYPEYQAEIEAVVARVVDLMRPFAQRVIYHYEFQGSHSIKKALPALAPHLSYKELPINEGSLAASEWQRMAQSDDPADKALIYQNLLDYCRLDTLAMVEILRVMQK